MNIRILIDNETKNTLVPEWGLAVFIEYEGHKILLDTGASGQFLQNAKEMGIDLHQVEFGVLSHAHYDHADGMGAFFEENTAAPFYLRVGSDENCWSGSGAERHYIGIKKGLLAQYKDRLRYVGGDYAVVPGVYLLPHKTPHMEQIGRKADLYVQIRGGWRPDAFTHEQSLVFDTERGLVIFNSCSHGGADNIIRETAETFPDKKIYAMLGGFHLFRSTDDEIRAFAKRVRDTGIEQIYTGHCTGQRALEILREELGDCVRQIYTGMEIYL